MTHRFDHSQEVPAPLEAVFTFFSDAANLAHLTPPALGFQMLTPPPVQMAEGTEIDYRIRMLGLPLRWRARITRWNPPFDFEDTQLRGPYREWVHRHAFEPIGANRTRIVDHVEFGLPLPPFGELGLSLARITLRQVFAFRGKALAKIFPD